MKKKIVKGILIGIGGIFCFMLGWFVNDLVIYKYMDDINDFDEEFDEIDEEENIEEGE